MKKILGVVAVVAAIGFFAQAKAEGVYGFVYKSAIEPASTASEIVPAKMGTATCKSYFGIVALGECGVKEAMKNGGITGLAFYDTQTKNILGYKKVTTRAFGK